MPASLGRYIVGPALPRFFERYPDMVLELGSTDRPVDLVAEGVDCVIRGGLVHDDTLVARPLGSLRVMTCAAPGYLATHGTPTTLTELLEPASLHRFVNFHSAKTGRVFPFEFMAPEQGSALQQIHRPHWVSCNDAGSYIAAVTAGMGLGQVVMNLPNCELMASGQLVPVLQAWAVPPIPFVVLYPRNRHLTAKVRAFADWVAELFLAEQAAAQLLYP
jgi:LysR family transcriptional regulator for bpeEF and oprC